MVEWLKCASKSELDFVFSYTNTYDIYSAAKSLIKILMNSKAEIVIIPLQDYLGCADSDGRMNTPSVASGNWTWRATKGDFSADLSKYKINVYGTKDTT